MISLMKACFFSGAPAGGFLCGGLEHQPRNDDCLEPTAEYLSDE